MWIYRFLLLFILFLLSYWSVHFPFGYMPKKKIDECLHCSIRSLFDIVVRSLSFLSARQQITSLSPFLHPYSYLCWSTFIVGHSLCLLECIRTNGRKRKQVFQYNKYAVGCARLRVSVTILPLMLLMPLLPLSNISTSIFFCLYEACMKRDVLNKKEECMQMNELICNMLKKKMNFGGKLLYWSLWWCICSFKVFFCGGFHTHRKKKKVDLSYFLSGSLILTRLHAFKCMWNRLNSREREQVFLLNTRKIEHSSWLPYVLCHIEYDRPNKKRLLLCMSSYTREKNLECTIDSMVEWEYTVLINRQINTLCRR